MLRDDFVDYSQSEESEVGDINKITCKERFLITSILRNNNIVWSEFLDSVYIEEGRYALWNFWQGNKLKLKN